MNLLAVDPQLNRIAVQSVTLDVIAQDYVSVVTKKENGNLRFESVLKERIAKSEKIAIGADGLNYRTSDGRAGRLCFGIARRWWPEV